MVVKVKERQGKKQIACVEHGGRERERKEMRKISSKNKVIHDWLMF